jgi:hypothetical protein
LSVVGIWRHIAVPQFPAMHARANLVVLLRGRRTEVGPHPFSVRLLDPSGNVVLEHGGTMHVTEPPAGVVDLESPAVMVLDLPLSSPGEYAFVVELDNMLIARVPFQVAQIPGTPSGGMH